MIPMPKLVEQNVAKSRDVQAALREAIAAHRVAHPGRNRQDAIDAVLLSGPIADLHKSERCLAEMEKGRANRQGSQHAAAASRNDRIDFMTPIRGQTGYDASVDGRRPHDPHKGETPIIRDHHQVLDDIKSGKLLWNDPKVSALVALERKQIFEKNN
jgi:hypothetical protein